MTNYNLKNIRILLIEGFTNQELRRLCRENSEFKPVDNDLAANTGKNEIVDKLLDYAERKLQFDRLLALVKELNPARYRAHQPYLDSPIEITSLDKAQHAAWYEQLAIHRKNLNELELKQAKFGSLHTPTWLLNQIDDEKKEIERLERLLKK